MKIGEIREIREIGEIGEIRVFTLAFSIFI